jgi:hypothetical protein
VASRWLTEPTRAGNRSEIHAQGFGSNGNAARIRLRELAPTLHRPHGTASAGVAVKLERGRRQCFDRAV